MLLIAIITVFGCQKEKKNTSKRMIPVPTFEINVDLNEKAEREMRERSETIHISLWLYGIPRKDSGIKHDEMDKAMGLVLGFFEKEINEEGVVRFEGLNIPESLYNALEDKNYLVSTGIRSGWKSSKFDLLDCKTFEKPISEVVGKQHTIKCKLIHDG
jgi:hypothetical protein